MTEQVIFMIIIKYLKNGQSYEDMGSFCTLIVHMNWSSFDRWSFKTINKLYYCLRVSPVAQW